MRLASLFLGFLSFSLSAANTNEWYPDPSIPNSHLLELYTFNGTPKDTTGSLNIKILVNHGFAVGYSEKHKQPLYAVYRYANLHEKSEKLKERYYQRPPKFQIDPRTKAKIHTNDYIGAKLDRGHMAPNFGIRTQYGHLAQLETFFMSNISPQHKDLNRGIWARAEKKVVNKLAQDDNGTEKEGDDFKDLWVISGPIFEGELDSFGDKNISIPTGFYKIMVRKSSYQDKVGQVIAIYYPHFPKAGEKPEQFVSVDWLEEKTGLDFHPNHLDKHEKKLESKIRDWNWKELDN